MSSIESLSWHTAGSHEIIDVDESDNNVTEWLPINNNDHKNGLVSDNHGRTTFIEFPTKNVQENTRKNKSKNGCYRWAVKTRPNGQCARLKIPWIITLISVIQVSGSMNIPNVINSSEKFSILQIVVHYIGCDTTINALIFTPTRKHELWRFFSYDFLHSGPVHLYSNVALQVFLMDWSNSN